MEINILIAWVEENIVNCKEKQLIISELLNVQEINRCIKQKNELYIVEMSSERFREYQKVFPFVLRENQKNI